MKLWILGARGLLGSALHKLCQQEGIEAVATGRLQADIGDLADLRRAAAAIAPTHIINCAAYTHVDQAEDDQQQAYRVNATGPKNLGIIAQERGIRCLHVSTDCVFDGKATRPYHEEDPCAPLSIYGKSKRLGEEELLALCPSASIIRTSWVFGFGGKNFISSVIERMRGEQELRAAVEQRTRPTWAPDLCAILLRLVDHSGIYHFANEGELSRYEIARDIHAAAKQRGIPLACQRVLPASCTAFPSRAPRPLYSPLDTRKVENLLGIQPRTWPEVLHEYIQQIY